MELIKRKTNVHRIPLPPHTEKPRARPERRRAVGCPRSRGAEVHAGSRSGGNRGPGDHAPQRTVAAESDPRKPDADPRAPPSLAR